jgi:hypothetical protein
MIRPRPAITRTLAAIAFLTTCIALATTLR